MAASRDRKREAERTPALPRSEQYLTLEQAAEMIQVSPRSIQRAVAAGHLRCLRAGRLLRFRLSDIAAWLGGR
jgi:excisionase family DNA binding protein